MKRCSKCKKFKPLNEFAVNITKSDGLDYHCKDCHKEYARKHYIDNKSYYKDKANKRRYDLLQWYKDYKSKLSCEQCGENHPACLDFHHTDRSLKETSLTDAIRRGWSINRLLKEISKCKVLCCKCHRILHFEEKRPVGVTDSTSLFESERMGSIPIQAT